MSTDPGVAVQTSATAEDRSLSAKVAGSAASLFVRRIVVTAVSAVATAVLARQLGVADFGAYSSGLATYYLLCSVQDFGFGYTLARRLGQGRADDGELTRSMIRLQVWWSLALAVVTVGVAVAAGLGAIRGQVLLVMVPAIVAQSLSSIRQVYYATYTSARLGLIDIVTNVVAAVALCLVPAVGLGATAAGVVMSASVVVNAVAAYRGGRHLMDVGRPSRALARKLLRESLPLGLGSVVSSAYFMLDLTIIGFLVSSTQLGYYAAAVKGLGLLVTVPGIVVTAAMSAIASQNGTPSGVGALAARLWHWLAALALPLCAAVGVFAPTVVELMFGDAYGPAVPLLRIVCGAAAVTLVSNVLGTVLVGQNRSRWLLTQNVVGLVVNVVGNLLLVPRHGVVASAWLTLVTELVVCTGSVLALQGRMDFGPALRVGVVPVLATIALIGTGLLLGARPVVAMVAAATAFLALMAGSGSWPIELGGRLPSWVSRRRPR